MNNTLKKQIKEPCKKIEISLKIKKENIIIKFLSLPTNFMKTAQELY